MGTARKMTNTGPASNDVYLAWADGQSISHPRMKTVGAIAKGHDQAGVGNSPHERANPFREERSWGR